jgi:hypothetical protein
MSFRKFKDLTVAEKIQLLSRKFYEKELKRRVRIISKHVGNPPNDKQLHALSMSLIGYFFAPFSENFEYFRERAITGSYNKGEEFIMMSKSAFPYVFGLTEVDGTREIVGLAVVIRDYFSRYPLDAADRYLLNGEFSEKTLSQVADECPDVDGDVVSEDFIKKRIKRHFF